MFHHKLKNPIVVSSLQFCIFQPQPAIQLLQRDGQVVALWAVMDANEDLTVDFHSKDIQPVAADGCLPYFSDSKCAFIRSGQMYFFYCDCKYISANAVLAD